MFAGVAQKDQRPWWARRPGPVLEAWARQVFGLDARSLGAMRLALGIILVADLAQRMFALGAHYTDGGVLPRALEARLAEPGHWTLLDLSGSPAFCAAVFCVALVCAALFAAGFFTRSMTVACWILVTSIQNRNPLLRHSGDDLLRLAFFWGAFLPLGASGSVDARGVGRRGPLLSVGTVCFTLQMLFFFGFLLDHKLLGHSWTQGSAVGEALSVEQYRRPLGAWLLGHPALLPPLTYGVLVAQGLIPLCLVLPLRPPWPRLVAIALTAGMQLGFGLCFRLGHFPWTSAAVMLAFLPPEVWRKLTRAKDEEPAAGPGARARSRFAVWLLPLVSIALAALWNLGEAGATFGVSGEERRFSDTALGQLARVLRVDQRWAMFAPNPQTEDGWLVLAARTQGPEVLDLRTCLWDCTHGAPLADDRRPQVLAEALGPHRWAMLLLDAALEPKAPALEGLATYACGRWNDAAPAAHRAQAVEVIFWRFDHLPDGTTAPLERRRLWNQPCP